MRLGQVLAWGALALNQIGDSIQPEAVDPEIKPEVEDVLDLANDQRIVEVEIRLVGVEAVPVVSSGNRIPGPVRDLRVNKDDAGLAELAAGFAPNVEVALRRALWGPPGAILSLFGRSSPSSGFGELRVRRTPAMRSTR